MTRLTKVLCISCTGLLFFLGCKKQDQTVTVPPPPPAPLPSITMRLQPRTEPVGNSVLGYYAGLPSDYDTSGKRYPLLLFIPGAGQFGNGANDLHLLLNDGPAQLIDEGRFPGAIRSGGNTFSFIVFTPQLRWYPSTEAIAACVEYACRQFRVDTSRIYLSGLSMGGTLISDLAAVTPRRFAAILPMAGVSRDFDVAAKARAIAAGGLPVWAFHCADDPSFSPSNVRSFINTINSSSPAVRAKLTEWPNGGHDAWTRALEPNYREGGMNIYEWMLQYRR
jgi:predicted peptidase